MMEEMSQENMEEVKVLEAQIKHLEAEVSALKGQQQDNHKDITFHFRGEMQDAMLCMCGQRQGDKKEKEKVLSRLKEEVEELEVDLKLQAEMNGISLTGCTIKTLQSSDRKLVQQLCVSGHCSELVFQVEFQLSEVKEGSGCVRTISDLNVVMDASDLQNFGSFLSGVEESRDLLLLFRTLRTFSNRCDDRRRTFQHFQPAARGRGRLVGCVLPVNLQSSHKYAVVEHPAATANTADRRRPFLCTQTPLFLTCTFSTN
ncbi:centromere protein P isoform X2 [Cyclopterus lumpus]|uniref:centromere protein P isoform X2 n=1 Tax=Cyclopterus lumpus TaxID=8103 RepID=UPI0014872656|nr:centromere protein P isoform X2 [Cyclopterus lumpus]